MKNNKEMRIKARRRAQRRRVLTTVLLMALVAVCAVGGTLAWLTAQTDPITNTFTTSNINITLSEDENLDLQMVPGHTITKDPLVVVADGSEACYVFVKLEESENFDDYMEYTVGTAWTALEGVDGVYYHIWQPTDTTNQWEVIKGDTVTVLDTVTKDMMKEAENNQPTLTVTAYACQYYKSNGTAFTAVEAWDNVKPTTAA